MTKYAASILYVFYKLHYILHINWKVLLNLKKKKRAQHPDGPETEPQSKVCREPEAYKALALNQAGRCRFDSYGGSPDRHILCTAASHSFTSCTQPSAGPCFLPSKRSQRKSPSAVPWRGSAWTLLPTGPLATPGAAPGSLWDWSRNYQVTTWGPRDLLCVHKQVDKVRKVQRAGENPHSTWTRKLNCQSSWEQSSHQKRSQQSQNQMSRFLIAALTNYPKCSGWV